MKPAVVEVSNLLIENIFEWMHGAVSEEGGDGTGLLVSSDYKTASVMFSGWMKHKYPTIELQRFEGSDCVVISYEPEEAYVFSSVIDDASHYEYIFIIKEACYAMGGAGGETMMRGAILLP